MNSTELRGYEVQAATSPNEVSPPNTKGATMAKATVKSNKSENIRRQFAKRGVKVPATSVNNVLSQEKGAEKTRSTRVKPYRMMKYRNRFIRHLVDLNQSLKETQALANRLGGMEVLKACVEMIDR